MPLQQPTLEFLRYLNGHPSVRRQIRAAPGKTMLYAGTRGPVVGGAKFGGSYTVEMWQEIQRLKKHEPQYADKEILPEVLGRTPAPDTSFTSLLRYVGHVERELDSLRRARGIDPARDGNVLWRALSGVFAANADGPVSICIGRDITKDKVFVSTELPVLLRNTKLDADTRAALEFYQRCIQNGTTDIAVSIIRA